jgi:hypothetical protein
MEGRWTNRRQWAQAGAGSCGTIRRRLSASQECSGRPSRHPEELRSKLTSTLGPSALNSLPFQRYSKNKQDLADLGKRLDSLETMNFPATVDPKAVGRHQFLRYALPCLDRQRQLNIFG